MQDTNTGTELIDLPPSEELPPTLEIRVYKPEISDVEISALAKRIAREYKGRIDFYTSEKQRKEYPQRTQEEEVELANWPVSKEMAERAMQVPAESLSWQTLDDIFSYNPELFLRKWEEMKFNARTELKGGVTALAACSPEDSPYEKAQFLALREELADEWNPRNGIERNLLDQMAMAYTTSLYWQKIMFRWMNLDATTSNDPRDRRGEITPRLTTFEAVNRAADMIDKFQRMFLRTLRALQNMRRYAPVIVQNAGQVNVGQQQVNVTPPAQG